MPPPTTSRALLPAALSVLAMLGAGCAHAAPGAEATQSTEPLASAGSSPSANTSPSAGSNPSAPASPTPGDTPEKEKGVKIQITIGEQRLGATLTESAAARDLVAQLPVTIDMVDHGQVEKTGRLPAPLSLEGQPDGADPDVGDLGYYAPGNDLVLYYGDQSYYRGIVILGRLDGDAAQRISRLDGPITATVRTAP